MSWKVFSPLWVLERVCVELVFLKHLVKLTIEAIWIWIFVIGRLSLFILEWVLAICIFQGICQFHFCCWIYWHKGVPNIPLLFFFSICRIFRDDTSFIPYITNLSFLINLARDLSILLIFPGKKCFCIHWFFSMAVVFYFIDCHFGLYFFFSSAYFGFNLLSFV